MRFFTLQNEDSKLIVAFENIFYCIEILLAFYFQAIILIAYAAAEATVFKGRRFFNKFGPVDDIFLLALTGGVKRPFQFFNDKIFKGTWTRWNSSNAMRCRKSRSVTSTIRLLKRIK